MGSEQLEAGLMSTPKPMPGVNGSVALKPQVSMRWMLTVWALLRRLDTVWSRSVAS